jgi:uncharacterized membrane protein YfcA
VHITPYLIAIVMSAGAVAGCLGAMLGIGGGVFLVPFLNVALGLPLNLAAGISLITVIATSSVVSSDALGKRLMNLRLGMLLQVAASSTALIAGIVSAHLPPAVLNVMFAGVTATVAVIVLSRLDRRNVITDTSIEPGPFGGRFYEEESGREVAYRTKRMPAALSIAAAAGFVSGSLGIGGGVLQVPALNAWCGIPMRVAAATSVAMIGVTAAASVPIYYARGDVSAPLAAAAVVGVLVGSRAGLWVSARAKAKWLKLLMSFVLIVVSVIYVAKAW